MKKIFYLFPLIISIPAAAQQDSTGKQLEEIIVTAQRTRQKNELTPYSVSVISSQYFKELMPRTTPEALQGLGGVFVQKTNHGGGSPFVRGLTGNQTLLLVDGVRLSNATFRYGPNQYLNTVDAFTVDRIEVAKGTGSVQYGTDALGGVIHVITKDPQLSAARQLHGGGVVKYMSRDMEKTARGFLDYSSSDFGFTGGLTYKSFGDLYGGDTTGRQHPSGYNELAFDGKIKVQLNPVSQITFANQFVQQHKVPVYHKVVLENFRTNEMALQQRNLHYLRYHRLVKKGLVKSFEMTTSWQQQREKRSMQKNGSTTVTNERDRTSSLGFNLSVFTEFNKYWTASSGIEVYSDRVNSNREDLSVATQNKTAKRGLYPDGGQHNSYSVYSLHNVDINKWTMQAGLRYNYFQINIRDTTLGKVFIRPWALVGNAGINYHLTQKHHLYISFNQGFRVPNLDDMGTLGIVDFRYELPSYNLNPERSLNYEAGYKLSAKRLHTNVAAFYMKLSDFITRVKVEGQNINNYPVYQKINSEHSYIKGAEAALAWDVVKHLSLQGHIAYAYGQNKSKNEPMRRIPPLNGRAMSTYRKNNWYATAEVVFASKQDRLAKGDTDDNRIPKGGTPGWKVFNAYAGYEKKHWSCRIGAQNISNEDYRTHGSGINGVGRSFWLSMTLHL